MAYRSVNPYHLVLRAALALLVGCGGSQPPIGAPGPARMSTTRSGQLGSIAVLTTEFLYSPRVKERCFGISGGCNCVFHANGKASGPFPGRFSARGGWNATRNDPWKFSETFSIRSSTEVITGTISGQGAHPQMKGGCVIFGPHVMTYAIGSRSGQVRVRFRWHHTLLEHFQGLQQ